MSNATTKAVLLSGTPARIRDLAAHLTSDQLYDDVSSATGKATTPDSHMVTNRSNRAAPICAGSWARVQAGMDVSAMPAAGR
jgi:hypothetical protein